MRIAQVSPLFETVPPKTYGGTERVVSYLTEELVRQGHEVTLFASGDSITKARLKAGCARSLRTDETCQDPLPHHLIMLEHLLQEAENFDVVHFHIDYLHFPISRRTRMAHLTTLHGRLDLPDLVPLYRAFPEVPVVSISNAQRQPLPFANWVGTVHHGLPDDLYQFQEAAGKYLAFVGRISPEKGVHTAIEAAVRACVPLKIAAKVDKVDRAYFEEVVRPMLKHPLIEFIGEIGQTEKNMLLGGALALMFPIDWPEPFGLVMIEAMACGTPVIAFNRGSVPEVLRDGVTGLVVNNLDDAVTAVAKCSTLDRRRCRQEFERNFTVARMASDYLAHYHRLRTQLDPKRREGEEGLKLISPFVQTT